MDESELEPRRKPPQPKDLSLMGIAELEAYIAELESEIARVQGRDHRQARAAPRRRSAVQALTRAPCRPAAPRASARRCRARRMTAFCAAAASSSPTSDCRGCSRSRFLRSPLAHARMRSVEKPAGSEDRVFTAADLAGVEADPRGRRFARVQGVRAAGARRGQGAACRRDRSRCASPKRGQRRRTWPAEIIVDFEELPVVSDMLAARRPARRWCTRRGATISSSKPWSTMISREVARTAPVKVTRTFRTARQCMAPLEGRGLVAQWHTRLGQLVLHSATQMPHIVRSGLAECLGLDHAKIRVVAPDVGGGFGYKGILLPRGGLRLLAGDAARTADPLDRGPPRASDGQRQLPRAPLRDHRLCRCRGPADRDRLRCDGRFRRLFSYPFSACLDRRRCEHPAGTLPLREISLPHLGGRHQQAADPALSRCGARRRVLCDRADDRRDRPRRRRASHGRCGSKISSRPRRCRSTTSPASISTAATTRNACAVLSRRSGSTRSASGRRASGEDRRIGVGFAIFCEQGAHGTSVYHGWGIPMVPGHEQASARLTPDGGLELRVGVHSHGQGLETTLAQIAHEILGIETAKVSHHHGDTADTLFDRHLGIALRGDGGGCRCGRVPCSRRARQADRRAAVADRPGLVGVAGGRVIGPVGSVSLAEVARVWYRAAAEPAG